MCLLDLLDELATPPAHHVNAAALDHCPEIAAAPLARGDELVGQRRTNAERQDVPWEEDKRRLIQQGRDAILRHGGTPRGWLGPLRRPERGDATRSDDVPSGCLNIGVDDRPKRLSKSAVTEDA